VLLPVVVGTEAPEIGSRVQVATVLGVVDVVNLGGELPAFTLGRLELAERMLE
jgi:hypothetical protein